MCRRSSAKESEWWSDNAIQGLTGDLAGPDWITPWVMWASWVNDIRTRLKCTWCIMPFYKCGTFQAVLGFWYNVGRKAKVYMISLFLYRLKWRALTCHSKYMHCWLISRPLKAKHFWSRAPLPKTKLKIRKRCPKHITCQQRWLEMLLVLTCLGLWAGVCLWWHFHIRSDFLIIAGTGNGNGKGIIV